MCTWHSEIKLINMYVKDSYTVCSCSIQTVGVTNYHINASLRILHMSTLCLIRVLNRMKRCARIFGGSMFSNRLSL